MLFAFWALAISYDSGDYQNCTYLEVVNSYETNFFVKSLKKKESFCIKIEQQENLFDGFYGVFIFNLWEKTQATAYYNDKKEIILNDGENQGFSFGRNTGCLKIDALGDTIINVAMSTYHPLCEIRYALRQADATYDIDYFTKRNLCWFNGATNKQTMGFFSNSTRNRCKYKVIPIVKNWIDAPRYTTDTYVLPQSNPGLGITRCLYSYRRTLSTITITSKVQNFKPVNTRIYDEPRVITTEKGLTGGEIAGIVIGSVFGGSVVIFLISFFCCCCFCDDCSDEIIDMFSSCCKGMFSCGDIDCKPKRCTRKYIYDYSYSDDKPPVVPVATGSYAEAVSSPYQ